MSFDSLPAAGYDGPVPGWPLKRRDVFYVIKGKGGAERFFDEVATQEVAERELELWAWAWTLPQACAWAHPSETWRLMTIAMWVRTYVVCEGSDATAADKNSLHRLADQIGMTPAGLRENGWQIKQEPVEVADPEPSDPQGGDDAPKRRLRAV